MGRKKKKISKPWCWYCNREFDDEKILLQHQKAKHFKCHICYKKLFTGPGLAIHCMQVHKEQIDKVPNSMPNRNNVDIEIYGMEGIPEADIKEHERQKHGRADDDEDVIPAKVAKPDNKFGVLAPPPIPGMIPNQMIPGMPPRHGMMPPNVGMIGGHMPPMLGVGGMPPLGMPPPFMPPGMVAGPMLGPGRMPMTTPSALQPPLNKPLFPVASNHSGSSTSTPVGADFRPINSSSTDTSTATVTAPPKPTFPAYSGESSSSANSASSEVKSNATISAEPTVKKSITTMTSASGARSRIIHPDEDISLEERRARQPKYQRTNIPGVGGVNSSAPNNVSGLNVMRQAGSQGMPPRGSQLSNSTPPMMYQQPPPMMQQSGMGPSIGSRLY